MRCDIGKGNGTRDRDDRSSRDGIVVKKALE